MTRHGQYPGWLIWAAKAFLAGLIAAIPLGYVAGVIFEKQVSGTPIIRAMQDDIDKTKKIETAIVGGLATLNQRAENIEKLMTQAVTELRRENDAQWAVINKRIR